MQKDNVRLRHMLDSAKEALVFTEGRSKKDLYENRMLALSLIKEIEIIGEAATKLSDETKAKYDKIPWLVIIGMRNHLVHVYFDIDLEALWSTVKIDLPPLISELEKIVPEE